MSLIRPNDAVQATAAALSTSRSLEIHCLLPGRRLGRAAFALPSFPVAVADLNRWPIAAR